MSIHLSINNAGKKVKHESAIFMMKNWHYDKSYGQKKMQYS
ncbi:hypothetical protein HMPREF9081_1341 [Centipeda periodontii DSM 2778]|uniref:Uncharacterized protein n=1 Tax=Centipeda periodontii DSM 2778 TaxID=888060 RepID=F5RM55_9FIRM|nr:hypothetical protein HMPREF9081_1341 [Centipeda periodontii DSM 2778]